MVGYTDLDKSQVWDHYQQLKIHEDACSVLAYHLNDQDTDKKVNWECSDVWAGNADDLNLKKFRKNQHQINEAIKNKGKRPLPKQAEVDENDANAVGFTRGDGKCRDYLGDFNTEDSYFPTGPNDPRPAGVKKRVRSI